MKKNILLIALLTSCLFIGCKKDDGGIPKEVLLERVPVPKIVKNGGSLSIDMTNLAGFTGKFDVGLLFASDIPPAKLDVVIRKNNNNSLVKLFDAGLATFPKSYSITAENIKTLFGEDIKLGDSYDVGVDVYTQMGKKYQAFPLVGGGYASAVGTQAGGSSSLTVNYSAICAYNPDIYQGTFVVVEDGWADWFPGDEVQFTKIDNTHFSFFDPFATGPLLPAIVTINSATNVATIPRVTVGTNWAWSAPGTTPGPTIEGTGIVAPCDKTITLNMNYGYGPSGVYGGGPYILKLVKK